MLVMPSHHIIVCSQSGVNFLIHSIPSHHIIVWTHVGNAITPYHSVFAIPSHHIIVWTHVGNAIAPYHSVFVIPSHHIILWTHVQHINITSAECHSATAPPGHPCHTENSKARTLSAAHASTSVKLAMMACVTNRSWLGED